MVLGFLNAHTYENLTKQTQIDIVYNKTDSLDNTSESKDQVDEEQTSTQNKTNSLEKTSEANQEEATKIENKTDSSLNTQTIEVEHKLKIDTSYEFATTKSICISL